MAPRRRKRNGRQENADKQLDRARAQHAEQARKQRQEQERLIGPMEALAESNHLAALVWDVIGGNRGA